MNVSRSGSATGSRSDDADDAPVTVHPHMHLNDSVTAEESGKGTGGLCGADEDGGFLHTQPGSSTHKPRQSYQPLDQSTGRSAENAVPIYY